MLPFARRRGDARPLEAATSVAAPIREEFGRAEVHETDGSQVQYVPRILRFFLGICCIEVQAMENNAHETGEYKTFQKGAYKNRHFPFITHRWN